MASTWRASLRAPTRTSISAGPNELCSGLSGMMVPPELLLFFAAYGGGRGRICRDGDGLKNLQGIFWIFGSALPAKPSHPGRAGLLLRPGSHLSLHRAVANFLLRGQSQPHARCGAADRCNLVQRPLAMRR